MKIPFSPPYIDADVIQEVNHTLESGWITTGPKVKALEGLSAEIANVPFSLGVNSATSGLMLALHWYGVGRGDEVIIPAYTYAATALAVLHLGAKPVMLDSGNEFNMDSSLIAEKVNANTKAIIPVDIGGWPCDYSAIKEVISQPEVVEQFNPKNEVQKRLGRLLILADAAHSIGALYQGQPAASFADLGVYSFHAVKNVTSAEGGMILINMPEPFNNGEIYNTLRLWSLNGQTKDAFTKTQGSNWRYDIVYPGFKVNMPDVLAALALGQLRKYKEHLLRERQRIFEAYDRGFKNWDLAEVPPGNQRGRKSSFHLYALRIRGITEDQRDAIIDATMQDGVSVNVHFQPLPLLTIFKEMSYDIKDYPKALDSYSREISLPIYPQLTNQQIDFIVDRIKTNTNRLLG